MSDSLCLYSTMIVQMRQCLPQEHMARVKTLAWMVVGLLLSGSANVDHWLPWVVHTDGWMRQSASLRRRFQRFLTNTVHVQPQKLYVPFIQASLQAWGGRELFLALDTTTLAGRLVILRLSVIYRGRAVPVCWQVLKQTSAMVGLESYRAWLRQAATMLPVGARPVLLGDRGFRDVDLMALCKELGWGFRLRLVKSEEAEFCDGTIGKLGHIRLAQGQVRFFQRLWLTEARYGPVHLAVGWADGPHHEPWYIASSDPAGWDTLREYGYRMDIDESFRDDKSGGFQLEASRLPHAEAVDRLLLALALAVLFLVTTATQVVAQGRRRQVDPHWQRGISYFHIGWRALRQALSCRRPLGRFGLLDPLPDPEPVPPKHSYVFSQVPDDVPILLSLS